MRAAIFWGILSILSYSSIKAQTFYFGADQSYVNEMEDCGAVYKENGEAKDVYQIFEDHNCNLVRLRLWHTPSWHDQLNEGRRYSDLADVKKSIKRAKDHHMAVLLDFHLSDNWADPSKQIIPAAWLGVVDNLPVLKDSLYNYIYSTLSHLKEENLLPEMVQIGNETNRGILLSPEQNQTWTLEWPRNAALFNTAIQAVRDLSPDIKVALHIADPDNMEWWIGEFVKNGVTDFDVIAMSYYWAFHQPTTIAGTGEVVKKLKDKYPDKHIMVVEAGHPWTTSFNDQANNVNNESAPGYTPPTPEKQKQWLIDLAQVIIENGGSGLIYWEPSWVSTPCWTQWGKGSHYEQATFFDFDHNLLVPGGIEWMEYDYGLSTGINSLEQLDINVLFEASQLKIVLPPSENPQLYSFSVSDISGKAVIQDSLQTQISYWNLPVKSFGVYVVKVIKEGRQRFVKKMVLR